jgi:hypothetical protein
MEDFTEDDLIQLSLLRDEEIDALIAEKHLAEDQRLLSPLDASVAFKYEELTLHVVAGSGYPVQTLEFSLENHSLSRSQIDKLRGRLRSIITNAETANNLQKWRDRETANSYGLYEPEMVVLALVREAFKTTKHGKIPDKEDPGLPFAMKNPVSAMSSSEMALHYLGVTAQAIKDEIPKNFRVLHIEEVLRRDLSISFDMYRQRLRKTLEAMPLGALRKFVPGDLQRSHRADDMIEHITKIRKTFHGTQRGRVTNIVRYGFIKPGSKIPGTGEIHGVRCGATYGRGIYSSPDPLFALSYSDWGCEATSPKEYFGLKLLVCATTMGRPRLMFRDDDWRLQNHPYEGADSHVGNEGMEYIVFEPCQILPVYVVHLDWGESNADHFYNLPRDPAQWAAERLKEKKKHPKLESEIQYAGDIKRAKKAALARASKYFPYGYGPATGARFTVEEVGEVSEDEEEYGEYQKHREQPNHESASFWTWVKEAEEEEEERQIREGGEAALADEYRVQRRPYDWSAIPGLGADLDTDEDLFLNKLMGDES